MEPIKQTQSLIGKAIVGDIEAFIKANNDAAALASSLSPDDGAKALAHAIAYGIAKALSSSSFQAVTVAGICGAPGTPVGTTMFNVLKTQCIEP